MPDFWRASGFTAGVGLVALVAASCLASHFKRVGAVVLALVAVVWLFIDSAFEGGTIVLVSTTHGVNTTDLAGVFALGYAIWLWFDPRRGE
jgi:PGF-CTERM protein